METTHGHITSLQRRLPGALAPSRAIGAMRQPHYAHRLDEPTGGLLLVGKSWPAMRALGEAFENRNIKKRYRALAWGRLEGRGLVLYTLDGRPSETEYRAVGHTWVGGESRGGSTRGDAVEGSSATRQGGVVEDVADSSGLGGAREGSVSGEGPSSVGGGQSQGDVGGEEEQWVTTLDLWPHTGRTHQLRRHLALIGHPLVGDRKYTRGYAKQRMAAGLAMPPAGHVRLAWGDAERGVERAATGVGGGELTVEEHPGGLLGEAGAGSGGLAFMGKCEGVTGGGEVVSWEPPLSVVARVVSGRSAGGVTLGGRGSNADGQPAGEAEGADPSRGATTATPGGSEAHAAKDGGRRGGGCQDGGKEGGFLKAQEGSSAQDGVVGGGGEVCISSEGSGRGLRMLWVGRLCLWAVQLDFQHPVNARAVHLELEEPEVFEETRRGIKRAAYEQRGAQ